MRYSHLVDEKFIPLTLAKDRINKMVIIFTTGDKVSKYSIPSV